MAGMYAGAKQSSVYATSLYASRPLPQIPPGGGGPDPQPAQALTGEPLDILLPTGLIIAVVTPKSISLQSLKSKVFKEARDYPLFNLLKDAAFYNFMGVTNEGTREEFVDEKQLLCDIGLFQPILKLVERQGSQEEKLFNAELSNLIGARVHDFEVMGKEIRDFRRELFQACKATVDRRAASEHSMLKYHYPPALESSDELPKNLRKIYSTYEGSTKQDGQKRNLTVSVLFFGTPQPASKVDRYEAHVEITVEALAEDLLELALMRLDKNSDIYFPAKPHECVLKVVGREEYMIERKPISQYKYIRSAMLKGSTPKLVVRTTADLLSHEVEYFVMPSVWKDLPPDETGTKELHEFAPGGGQVHFMSTWDIKRPFSLKIISADHVNVAEHYKVYLRCGLYHGGEPLCAAHTTRPELSEKECCHWNENLEFELNVCDIPRSAKLCYVLYGSRDSQAKKKKRGAQKENIPIAWANQAVFDYACNLNTGICDLYMWPVHEELSDSLHYMGTTVLNSATHDTVCLKVEISTPQDVPEDHAPIMFPSREIVQRVNASVSQRRSISRDTTNKRNIKELQNIVNRDPLADLDDQDKQLVWYMREYCLYEMPLSLPKMIQSLSWSNHCEVAEMYCLLENWQALPPEKAMELLDYHYPDIAVRNWAVTSLENMDDTSLSKYLLQLVQVLKFEMYLDTALGRFLLKRALLNKRIGHTLFWHLRAEMHLPEVSVRFGLMLEAYCRGCGSYMQDLTKQYQALDGMRQISQTLQKSSGAKKEREQMKKTMQDTLHSPHYCDLFTDLRSPLDCSLQIASCSVKDCKYMDSKMKPLWMVFNNLDPLGDKIAQIFKQGDDLRQDMLTLQIIGIMDSFWQQEGLDLKMVPYGCLSTGDKIGMIDVVRHTQTLAKIQKVKGGGATGAFKNHILLDFLREHNPSGLDQAVDVFTRSCAGYCVATYVLGIGDRHSDNIMLAENGNLLHIDFGHFLGNFKSKLGVKRERVPFVLTNDFIYTIVKGDKAMEHHQSFKNFKKLCEDAFLLLRKHGDLFINLFAMMLSTGIPELRTADDVDYVRVALCLGQPQKDALASFQGKFQEAIRNNRSVAINWWMHNIAKQQN